MTLLIGLACLWVITFIACRFGFILPCHWVTEYTVWGEPIEAINLFTGRRIKRRMIDGVLQNEWR